jgi:putative membrane protein
MRKGSRLVIAALFAASVAACGGGTDANRAEDPAGTQGAAGTSGREAGNLAMGERNFIQDQLRDGMKEIQLGQLASQRGQHAAVKEFGTMMVEDHTKAGAELKQIASQVNVEVETDESREEARESVEKLTDLRGAEFDRDYIDMMVKDHQEAAEALEEQAQNAEHPDVKQWAASKLPRIKQHLEQAQQIQNQLKNSNRSQ